MNPPQEGKRNEVLLSATMTIGTAFLGNIFPELPRDPEAVRQRADWIFNQVDLLHRNQDEHQLRFPEREHSVAHGIELCFGDWIRPHERQDSRAMQIALKTVERAIWELKKSGDLIVKDKGSKDFMRVNPEGPKAMKGKSLEGTEERQATRADPKNAGQEPSGSTGQPDYLFQKVGASWEIAFAGEHRRGIPDGVGMQHIAELLRHPNPADPIAAGQFAGWEPRGPDEEVDGGSGEKQAQERLDWHAICECRIRISKIDAEKRDAKARGDMHRAEQLEAERQFLKAELDGAVTPSGHLRSLAPTMKARDANRVKRAIDRAVETYFPHSSDPVAIVF